MTTQAAIAQPKPYHHGDLHRALIEAAQNILERDGPGGLSLRAVAREAGVSPAAPYHHFKDKDELLLAVGQAGFAKLRTALGEAAINTPDDADKLTAIGLAYVEFAQTHPATYRVMYDSARRVDAMPDAEDEKDGGVLLVRDAIGKAAGGKVNEVDTHLAAVAIWCAIHGLAEMSGFANFQAIKDRVGGEKAFLRGVINAIFAQSHKH